jgi:predicted nucleic acid-binding protein
MIVVDTNVIGYLYLSSTHTERARRTLRKDSEWAAPVLWRSELRNVLATYISQSLLSVQDATDIAHEAERLMEDSEFKVSSDRVLTLAADSKCSPYDCEFVALAIALNVPLVTVDKQLLARFPAVSVDLRRFAGGSD